MLWNFFRRGGHRSAARSPAPRKPPEPGTTLPSWILF